MKRHRVPPTGQRGVDSFDRLRGCSVQTVPAPHPQAAASDTPQSRGCANASPTRKCSDGRERQLPARECGRPTAGRSNGTISPRKRGRRKRTWLSFAFPLPSLPLCLLPAILFEFRSCYVLGASVANATSADSLDFTVAGGKRQLDGLTVMSLVMDSGGSIGKQQEGGKASHTERSESFVVVHSARQVRRLNEADSVE